LFAGWRISIRKNERPIFYVRNRMEQERHIAELNAEGNDAFQQMYRMEYIHS